MLERIFGKSKVISVVIENQFYCGCGQVFTCHAVKANSQYTNDHTVEIICQSCHKTAVGICIEPKEPDKHPWADD